MAAYQFDRISPSEALAIQPTDTIFGGEYAPAPRITYLPATATEPERVQVTLGFASFEHTVVFNANIEQLSTAGRFTFPDGGKLIIGGPSSEALNGGPKDTVFGGGGADSITGTDISGGDGADTLSGLNMLGGDGDDRLIVPVGGTAANGGAGLDTLVFAGSRDDYSLRGDATGFALFGDGLGLRGVSFSNIEKLHFSDRDITLTNIVSVAAGDTAYSLEGDSGQVAHKFIASRTGDLGSAISVGWSAKSYDDADLVSASGQVSFAVGQAEAEILVYTPGDTDPEAQETFQVRLGDGASWLFDGKEASGGSNNDDGDAYAVLNIYRSRENGGDFGLSEGQSGSSPFKFVVTRTGDTTLASQATYRVVPAEKHSANEVDFAGGTFPTGVISFEPGEMTKTITINVHGDTTIETDEYFKVVLTNVSPQTSVNYGDSYGGAVGIILTDDTGSNPDDGPSSGPQDPGSGDDPNSGGSDPSDDGSSNPPPSAGVEHDIGGDNGPDTLQGTAGNDTITGGDGVGYLRGGEGDDIIAGGKDFDDINGNQGADTASGGGGDDWVVGGKDNDSLTGDAGGDIVYGNLGDDTCDGGDGADIVRGGQQNDFILGGAGNDWLSGDRGDDTLAGGAGADIFHTFGDAGIDRVTDFSLAEGDRVLLDPGTTYSLSQAGADTVITIGGGGQMILVGVSMASLTGDWIFGA